jgi:hypothetical protein
MASKSRIVVSIKFFALVISVCLFMAGLWEGEIFAKKSDPRTEKPANAAVETQPAITFDSAQTSAPEETVEQCLICHKNSEPMHRRYKARTPDSPDKLDAAGKDRVGLTCTGCHGGNPTATTQKDAHVQPRFPKAWGCKNGECSSRNPERSNTLIAKESFEFVRFVNPGDFRVLPQTCASCHTHKDESAVVASSMMSHGAMLWGAALYNNGGFPIRDTHFGESYSSDGQPQALIANPAPTREETAFKGWLSSLYPLPRWEISQPGNILRVFERGSKRRLEVALPDKEEDNGRPDKGLSPRGLGTNNRTDPVYLGLQKTRLLDPTLNFLGTNDHPGDYRSAGCTACHVIYANDTSLLASGKQYADKGNQGFSHSTDTAITKKIDGQGNVVGEKEKEPGHPIKHQFTTQIPTAQCMTCHMHPGTNMVATYLGRMWWDNETDGKYMYPSDRQINPSQSEEVQKLRKNPEGSSLRGLWSDSVFLQKTGTADFNAQLKNVQFADSHGHGWVYKNVYKKDHKGNLLDKDDNKIDPNDPDKFSHPDPNDSKKMTQGKAVHLQDIHLEKGMHCTDCHFKQDSHGTGILYNEPRAAVEIGCADCHGSVKAKTTGATSGPASSGGNLTEMGFTLSNGQKPTVLEIVEEDTECTDPAGNTYELKEGDIKQNSTFEPGKCWKVMQTVDSSTEGNADYKKEAAYAHKIRKDNVTWNYEKVDEANESLLAHNEKNMTCYACHTSWVTSCFGCHLSMEANRKTENRHNEGGDSRNFTSYNFQVLRDDIFMLGKDGTVTGHRIAPVSSRSAVLVSSRNQNREWIYHQQQTLSAEGFSGQAFNTHVPHTVRAKETQGCSSCHVSKDKDNNAWMAQLTLQGTNFVNFMGRYIYIAATDALEAVAVTEHSEPQAVYGSNLHKLAYKDNFEKFVKGGRELSEVYENKGRPEALQVQIRGEYAYVAAGKGGLRVYDIAQIDHKGFSERIATAPVSPLGQKFYVDTKYAAAVAAPSTLAVDPTRWRTVRNEDGTYTQVPPDQALKMNEEADRAKKPRPAINEEGPIHSSYAYLYVADKYEGLILVNAATLLDGDPRNNFLGRSLTFNPSGVLNDANNVTIAGNFAYITTDRALVIIDISTPLQPKVVKELAFDHPKAVAVQFLYAFVVDEKGMHVVDIKELQSRGEARFVDGASVDLHHAHDIYVARTYAYVANGEEGIAIIDVERPEEPKLDQTFNANGSINDAHSIKVAMTNASLYGYVADGKNGLKVLQLTDPETMPTFAGFSPRPNPTLIATFKTKGEAVGISKGLDRDRAADESGNQVAVFGRRGARPFNFEDVTRLLKTNDGAGDFFTVSDKPVE